MKIVMTVDRHLTGADRRHIARLWRRYKRRLPDHTAKLKAMEKSAFIEFGDGLSYMAVCDDCDEGSPLILAEGVTSVAPPAFQCRLVRV